MNEPKSLSEEAVIYADQELDTILEKAQKMIDETEESIRETNEMVRELESLDHDDRAWIEWFYTLPEEHKTIVESCGAEGIRVTSANLEQVLRAFEESNGSEPPVATPMAAYDAAATSASKASIFYFFATFAVLGLFSGSTPTLFSGVLFCVAGMFTVSLLVAMPAFIVKMRLPQLGGVLSMIELAVVVGTTWVVYEWLFS